ncbi:MAG TPA: MarR family transcriptional regulator [Gaiellaceae bacterium]
MAKGTEPVKLAAELAPRISRLVRVLAREQGGASRTQISVLASLRDGGPQRITELARVEHVTQPTMTALVSRLEAEGWVERRSDPEDGRVVQVAITPAGLDDLRRLSEKAVAALADRIAALESSERATLEAALPALDRLVSP